MAIDYVLDPHLSSELPLRVRRRPHAANAVVCLSEQAVVNESRVFALNPFLRMKRRISFPHYLYETLTPERGKKAGVKQS